jgi:hypothetical protein
VTASAISQAERADRGLSLATVVRLSNALGITIDELLRGEDPAAYRIGRRPEGPERGLESVVALLGGDAGLRVDLVHLAAQRSGSPAGDRKGTAIVAVASGFVQVLVGGQTPAIRRGEVLVADARRIDGWHNLGQTEAVFFWITIPALR